MREGQGSRTAEMVAARRATHQLLDRPLIFEDPLALAVVRPDLAQRVRDDPSSFDRSPIARYLRAFLAVRSRYAEDQLRIAVGRGVRQYVILGAGLDTFAYRNPFGSALRVLEVDHPATQKVKRGRLAAAGVAIPPELTFVSADLGKVELAQAFAGSGFDAAAPAFFSWLGVVPYLELPAIRATFRFVASLPAGAAIVFDYGKPPSSLNWLSRFLVQRMAKRVAAAGEPWKTYFLPADLHRELEAAGFHSFEDLGPEEINRRYFAGRADRLRVGNAGHVITAATRSMGN